MINSVSKNPEQAMAMLVILSAVSISSAEISYTDDSLAQKLIAKAATEKNMLTENYKKVLTGKIKEFGKESDDEFVKNLVKGTSGNPKDTSVKTLFYFSYSINYWA